MKIDYESIGMDRNNPKHDRLIKDLNYWIEEGFIEVEVDKNNDIRLYPA